MAAQGGTVVKKNRTGQRGNQTVAPGEFDRDAILERLFALPLPPPPKSFRTYPVDTPLGRIMRLRGMMVRDVTKLDGTPNERVMTELLAGRKPIDHWRHGIARALQVDPRVL